MKLHSIRMEPASPAGWFSEELLFGKHVTELFGPNGCGKTPIIQSIVYALGFPVKFREDILSNCRSVALKVIDANTTLEIRRKISTQFDVEVSIGNGNPIHFYVDRDYSKFLFDRFNFSMPILTTTNGDPTPPYMATLLPLFYLDQDYGYVNAYRPIGTFIKDQYAEMMRLALSLPPKNSYDQKKLLIEKKRRLDEVDRLIVRKRTLIESLGGDLGGVRRPIAAVDADAAGARANLERINESRSVKTDAYSAIDSLLHEKQLQHRALSNEISELESRVNGFERIKNEIEVEVNTLSLNEEARRLFSSFKDICANTSCGLFLSSSESYGKNLLYLRDQIKDLTRNTESQRSRIDRLTIELKTVSEEFATLQKKREALAAGSEIDGLVEAVSELTRRLTELQKERSILEDLEEEEDVFVGYLNEQERLQNELASMSGTANSSDLRAIELRTNWRARIIYWLDVLKTRNVSREITIDADFEVVFGQEKLGQLKGSTLTRVVLALHTAFFEIYLRDPEKRLRFLILDTPRQQDIEREPLANYISEVKQVAVAHNAQVIFSTTDYHYDCTDGDSEWRPTFPGHEQKMFLGSTKKPT